MYRFLKINLLFIFFILSVGCGKHKLIKSLNNNIIAQIDNIEITYSELNYFAKNDNINLNELSDTELKNYIDKFVMIKKLSLIAQDKNLHKSDTYIINVYNIKLQLLIEMLNKQIFNNIVQPTELDLKQYYNRNKKFFKLPDKIAISNILADNKQNINIVKSKIEKGYSYIELKSDTELKKLNIKFSDLGIIQPDYIEPELSEKAFLLKENEFSDIIETKFGFHILYCYKIYKTSYMNFKQVKQQIFEQIMEFKFKKELDSLMKKYDFKSKIFYDRIIK